MVATFKNAVQKHYWYELFIDDLPIWGFVGPPPEETKDDEQIYIYTHKAFDINYNGNRVSYTFLLELSLYLCSQGCLKVHICPARPAAALNPVLSCCLQIIQVNLTSENPQPLVTGAKVDFTYSVRWTPTAISFARRFERYLDYNFFEHQVFAQTCIHISACTSGKRGKPAVPVLVCGMLLHCY